MISRVDRRAIRSRRTALDRRTAEAGRIVTMVPLASLAALICVGIGVDFSGQTIAEQILRDQVAGCARSSADWVSMTGAPAAVAMTSANQCLSDHGLGGIVDYSNEWLIVSVNGIYKTRILSIINVRQLPIYATATAGIAQGR